MQNTNRLIYLNAKTETNDMFLKTGITGIEKADSLANKGLSEQEVEFNINPTQ